MKTRFALIASLCLLAGCSAQGPDNRTADLRGKRVLVFTGHGEGYVHENIAASAAMILELAAQEDFAADTTSDKRVFCDDSLERYDAIVYANASYVGLDSAQRSAFERFIRRGGGFAGLHAATCTDDDWTWFSRMIGGRFDFHPPLQRLTMKIVDRTHPSASMLPDTLTTEDELYCFKRLDPQARVLAVWETAGVDWGSGPKPEVMSPSLPAVWCSEVDGGRIWQDTARPTMPIRSTASRCSAGSAGSWPAKRAIQKRPSDGTALRNRRAGTRRPSDNPVGERPSACGPTAAESLPGGRDRRQGRRNKTGSLFPPSDREQEESGDTRSDRRPERSGRIAARQTP